MQYHLRALSATMTASRQIAIGRSNAARRRIFFPAMAIFAIGLSMLAFVPEYFGHARMPPPSSWLVILHAAIMTAWISIFLLQAFLGATRRVTQHRRIGNYAFVLGCFAWLSMIAAEGHGMLTKGLPEELRVYDWLLPFVVVFLTFPILLLWAYRKRNQPDWHKRLVTLALFISLEAVVQRLMWIPATHGYWPFAAFLDICVVAPLVILDVTTLNWRLHPATIRGALVILVAQASLFLLWGTHLWRAFAYSAMHHIARI